MKSRFFGVLVTTCLSALAQDEQVVKIGHAAPMSGPQAHYGRDNENGVRMAIEDLNARGIVIGGKRIRFELVAEDDAGDPRQGLNVAKKLCDARVVGVVGHLNSGTTIPASKIYNECGIPHITGSATNPNLTKQGYETTYRLIASDNFVGVGLALYAADELKLKRIAVIDDRTAYGMSLADAFKNAARSKGVAIVDEQFTSDKATDFSAILMALKAKNPDAIFYGGMDPQAGPLLRQLEHAGLGDVRFLGGDGICTSELARLSAQSKMLSNVTCAEGGATLSKMPGGEVWKRRYDAKYPGQFQVYSPYTYDATFVFAEAMRRAGSVEPKDFLPYLRTTRLAGVTGNVTFESNGESGSQVTLYTYGGTGGTRFSKTPISTFPAPAVVPSQNARVVKTFFATDRKVDLKAGSVAGRFTNERAEGGALSWGMVEVSIPVSHKMGQIERPWWSRLADPEKHMMLLDSEMLPIGEFFKRVKSVAGPARRGFIFVHGYKVPFDEAALRTAQLAVDLDIGAVPVFYSWPSQGYLLKYTVDWTNVEWTTPHLEKFLEEFADRSDLDELYVIAHSMGSNAAVRALASILDRRKDLRARFKELVLAAPDMDADVFREQVLPKFRTMKSSVTMYASSNDKALQASVTVHKEHRAGLAGERLLVAAGLETIDASNIDTDWLAHSVYAEARPLLTDMRMLLKQRIRAEHRHLSEKRAGGLKYWLFAK